jgi:hypothetical protein
MSNDDIRESVMQDCLPIWQKSTIRDALPDEYKQKEKAQAGKKGRQKQLEQAGSAVTITEEPEVPVESWVENGSIPSKRQEYEDFESINRPNVKSAAEMYNKLQNELKSTKQQLEEERKSTEHTLREKEKEIQMLKESQNIEDIPQQLVDNKIGPVKVQNLSKISDFDRKWFQSLVRRLGELVRRRFVEQGAASVKFYVLGKDRTTNIEYVIPVAFSVDLLNKTTEVELNEARL